MKPNQASFTAADAFPVKVLLDPDARELKPIHVQWYPTNKCNLNCTFCSCAERDKTQEMPLKEALKVIRLLSEMGCKAATISGGGEPLCHSELPPMLLEFQKHDIAVGLVSNGILLDRLTGPTLAAITWCRLSASDERELARCEDVIRRAVRRGHHIDWAFSYVLSPTPNLKEIRRTVALATELDFTHVRIVADLLQPDDVAMEAAREALTGKDDMVIYQPRNQPKPGNPCLICYVKPLIGPDLKVYPCCGVQYAKDPMAKDLPTDMCLGDARDLKHIYGTRKARNFGCTRCYYTAYNEVLAILKNADGVTHREFV